MRVPPNHRAEGIFRLLLRCYPRDFRERYETDAVELFRDRYREAVAVGGTWGVVRLWMTTVPSMVVNGVRERATDVLRAFRGPGSWRSATRALMRAPAVTAAVVLTLGVGIGATVGMFGLLRGVLLAPLPYPEPDRLVRLWETNRDVDEAPQRPSPLNFADWERSGAGFEAMAAWYLTTGTYRTDLWAEEIRLAQVTPDFFKVLAVEPALGRDFQRDEVFEYGPVVLSHGLWTELFGADSSVVGRTITTSASSYEVVGVMPPDFAFPDESVQAWVGWNIEAVYGDRPETRSWRFLDAIARVQDGLSLAAAEEAIDATAAALAEAYPVIDGGWDVGVTPLHEHTVGDARPALLLAFGAVVCILVLACANVTNIMLARVPGRTRSLAIRSSLGATRGRLVRELMTESLIVAAAAAGVGLILAGLLLEAVVALDAGRMPRLDEVRMDGAVVLFAVGVALLTATLCGLAPALAALRGSVGTSLGDGPRTTASGRDRLVRETFVAAQVAAALVLLAGAGLFWSSLRQVAQVDPGFDAAQVATFRVSLDPVEGGAEEIVRYYDGLLDRIEGLPGVERAGAVQALPLSSVGTDFRRPFRSIGSALPAAEAPVVALRIASPGYLEAMRMRLLAGTDLPPDAAPTDPKVALVNATMAARLWPGTDPVGQSLELDFPNAWERYRVVGVVADVRHYGQRVEPAPEVFLSARQVPYLAMSVAVRTSGDPEQFFEPLRQVVLSNVPMQPARDFVSLDALLSTSRAQERFLSLLLGAFAAVALLLAATGLYGILAYVVNHRRAEIGVRMALGAEPMRVAAAVVGRALLVTGVGIVAGGLGVAVVARLVDGLLFGVSASDPRLHALVVVTLLTVTCLAAYLPARRAAHLSPRESLQRG